MGKDLLEAAGLLFAIIGLVCLVVAASMVDPRFGVAVAGAIFIVLGVMGVYLAALLARAAVAKPEAKP